ncbi:MAG: ABC transporter substrate-binding protein [Deltaproteobacteria bacterium]|nr:ABC transporter substrate-binding protein [Deltaproteobacteria bacterium]
MHRWRWRYPGILAILTLLAPAPAALAAKAEPIKLGAPLATAFLYGWDAERGIRLAVEEINAAGGVKVGKEKRPMTVDVIDTRDLEPGVPVDDAIKAVEKLILQKKVDFLVGGPVRSEAALAVMDLLSQYKKVSIITTGVLSPAYSKTIADNYDKYKYCFRDSSHSGVLIKDMVTLFDKIKAEHGLQKIFVMVQDVAHARKAGELVEKALKEKGYQVVGNEIYPTGTTDFATGLLKAKNADADVLFVWMDMPETAILLKQWKDFRLKILPVGFMGAAEQPGFWNVSKGAAQYVLVNVVNGGNAPAKITPWTEKFAKAYEKRWKLEPEGYGTSSSYMAVYLLKDAIERAGTLDSDAVVQALETVDLMGVYGRMRFDPKNHQVIAATDPKEGAIGCVFQWQDGKRVVVWPDAGATGTIKLPDWWMK